jgi:hypothetical protein
VGFQLEAESDRSNVKLRIYDFDDALSLVRYIVEKHWGLEDDRINLLGLESLDHRARSMELWHLDLVSAQVIDGNGIRQCGNPLPSQIISPFDRASDLPNGQACGELRGIECNEHDASKHTKPRHETTTRSRLAVMRATNHPRSTPARSRLAKAAWRCA